MVDFRHEPEVPAREEWRYETDIHVSDNGKEQRIELRPLPKRSFQESFVFDDLADIRRELASMVQFGGAFERPLFVYATRLTATATSGAASLDLAAALTDLRDGGRAYLFDRQGGEFVDIDTVGATSTSLSGTISRTYEAPGSYICPVTNVYVGSQASIGRLNPDDVANAQLTFRDTGFLDPFVHSFNTQTLDTLADLAILDRRPVGREFEDGFDTGIEVTDYGGVVDIRSPWTHAQQAMSRKFRSPRVADPADFDWWRVFADYTKGSCNPFWFSTWREDFALISAPSPSGSGLTWGGQAYLSSLWPHEAFRGVAIEAAAGVHYAQITNASASGSNTAITFSPALPSDSGWADDQRVSLLLKCRIADDRFALRHLQTRTEIDLNLRTVDE